VLYPGEPEARHRAVREVEGIPLQVDTWVNLCNIAKGFGIPIPA
jgi:LDH2 family malate/lactate/ureidoglycolate dehydrogenase